MPTDPTQLSSTVDAGEHILLGRESPLRRIPVNIQPKQAFFLDGIRHSIEMMDVSFGRLRNQLTQLALVPPEAKELASISAHIFLDAWSMVDAVDKFRQLYIGFPDMEHINSPSETRPLHEVLQSFRKLRNVGDHLSRQAELVLANGGAALGELTWLTGARILPEFMAWHCMLRPGTLRTEHTLPTTPIETTIDWPTDYICLSAGGHHGNLSQVRNHISIRIRHLESQLNEIFSRPELTHVPVINDFFGRRPVRPI